jgi:hypothetical protein
MASKTTVRIVPTRGEIRITVTSPTGDELLKALLPPPSHRWAMRMLLDALALLVGTRLSVVLSAEVEERFWTQDLWDGFGFAVDTICYEVDVLESRKRRAHSGRRLRLKVERRGTRESERNDDDCF